MSVRTVSVFDNVSVAVSSTAEAEIAVGRYDRIRPVITASGADITVTLETSLDGGVTWHELEAYAQAATGPQVITDLPGELVRLVASNGSAVEAQSVSASLLAWHW